MKEVIITSPPPHYTRLNTIDIVPFMVVPRSFSPVPIVFDDGDNQPPNPVPDIYLDGKIAWISKLGFMYRYHKGKGKWIRVAGPQGVKK